MEKDLRKRLKRAANNHHRSWYGKIATPRNSFLAGAEQGYKEAIKEAREWWWKNIDTMFGHKITKDEFDNLTTDFETDMNELLG